MRSEPSDEEAALSAALWGTDPVHPTAAAYRKMGELIEADLANLESRYTNPTQKHPSDKRPRTDLSLQRADWVAGCSAAASRRDNQRSMGQRPRALSRGGRAALRGARNRGNPGGSVNAASQREHQSTRVSAAAARGHFLNRGRRPSRGWRGRWGSF